MRIKKKVINFIKKQPLICALAAACLGSIVAMVIILANPKVVEAPFEAPAFEQAAAQGDPKVPEKLGWKLLHQEGMEFKVGLCGNLQFNEKNADVYFTNPAENTVWMKIRISDKKGRILAESGLIKPGEYIKSLTFAKKPRKGTDLQMRVMTYEPETYISAGAITLKTTIQ